MRATSCSSLSRAAAPRSWRVNAPAGALALLAGLGLAAPLGAQTHVAFGAWVLACDNTGHCAMTNAGAGAAPRFCPAQQPEAEPPLHVTLQPAMVFVPGGRATRVAGPAGASGPLALERRSATHRALPAGSVAPFLSALLDGGDVEVLGADGQVIGRAASDGSVEALDELRAVQARVRARRSTRQPSVVTSGLARLPFGVAPSSAVQEIRRSSCAATGVPASIGYRLLGDRWRTDRTLWVTPCEGAGGAARALLVIEQADGSAAPAVLLAQNPAERAAPPGLAPMGFLDAERGLLRETWHAPSPPAHGAACIIERVHGWNGRAFELVAGRRSLACVGSPAAWRTVTFTRAVIAPAPAFVPAAAAASTAPCERPAP
jgi:hypothetical protein